MELREYFSPHGPLRQSVPDFIPRPQQTQVSEAIFDALKGGRKAVIEAGTGVGKSLAYLLPSAIWATSLKKKVIVATHSKALQEQLVDKDLPMVQRVLKSQGIDLTFSLLMGSENYLCAQRLHRTMEGASDLLAAPGQSEILAGIDSWSRLSATGLRNRIPFEVPSEIWESVNRDADVCLGKHGPFWDTCLYRKDVNRARSSHILVVNQHLLIAGLPSWLDFDAIVIDEAHNLEDVAVSSLGVTLNDNKVKRLLDDTLNPKSGRGVVPRMKELPQSVRDAVHSDVNKAHKASGEFFVSIRDKLRLLQEFDIASGSSSKRVLEPQVVQDKLTGLLETIEQRLQQGLAHATSKEEEGALTGLSKRYLETVKNLRRFLQCNERDYAFWGELKTIRKKSSTHVFVKPVDVSKQLRERFFESPTPVICTSATLSANGTFTHFKERIGAETTDDLLVDSPFDYKENARLLIPHNFPDPSTAPVDFEKQSVRFCSELVKHIPGGIFFLFTSWKTLRSVAAAIKRQGVNRQIFTQGEELPAKLLRSFKSSSNGILLGTDTFWQGVDVPGAALSCVVITKLPFIPPDSPLEQARHEWYVRQGKDPFNHLLLPRAIIKFRQGFGRLIRTQSDIGAVVILDPRVRTKKYGAAFLQSIPACPEVQNLKDLGEFFVEKNGSGSAAEKAILALVGEWASKLPRSSVANILRGAESSDVIKRYGEPAFSGHFGHLKGTGYNELIAQIDGLLDAGKLTLRNGNLEVPGAEKSS